MMMIQSCFVKISNGMQYILPVIACLSDNLNENADNNETYPNSGCGAKNIGVILLRPSAVLVSICLSVG